MISRITRVKSYRGLQDWSCDGSVADFAAVNVVYGFNGSGKSTLCSLLRDAPSDAGWTTGLELEVTETGTRRSVRSPTDPFWQRIRVFNRDYVEANLRFDEADPTAIPLLVLGQHRLEAESRRTELQALIDGIDQRVSHAQNEKTAADNALAARLTAVAKDILAELQHLGGRYYPRRFDAGTVRRRLLEGFTAPPADTDVNALLAVVHEQPPVPVTVPSLTEFSMDHLVAEVRTVLTDTATSQVIDELRHHPGWNRWVQEGLPLHADRDTCIYCTGPLTEERRQALDGHFDESLRQLQARITDLASQLDAARVACARTLASLPTDEVVASDIRLAYYEARTGANLRVNRWLERLRLLEDALDHKRDSLFSALEPPALTGPPTVSLEDVAALLQRHNDLVARFEERRRTAAETIELKHVADVRDEASKLAATSERLEHELRDLAGQRQGHEQELSSLSSDDLDPVPTATALNDDLGRLLGRTDLRFSPTPDRAGYRITRAGEPATHLSEGERTAIALLYFLRSLESHGTELEKCTIVIDDPVSSLDRSAFTGLSSHLWRRLVHDRQCRQVMLFTHNFELLRHWLIQLKLTGARKTKHRCYEMRRRIVPGGSSPAWCLSIRSLDVTLETYFRSEYHYLFWRVADVIRAHREAPSLALDIEAEAVLPNACRRLLESFLGFKTPDLLGSLRQQVSTAGDGTVDDVTRSRVHQFLGRHSHLESADVTAPLDGAEGVQMLLVVLKYIHDVDPTHFSKMCTAVSVDEALLTSAFPRVAESSIGPEVQTSATLRA